MNLSSESESCHGESHVGSVEDGRLVFRERSNSIPVGFRNVNESATGDGNVTHEAEDAQHQVRTCTQFSLIRV